jgi:hypothetical protein
MSSLSTCSIYREELYRVQIHDGNLAYCRDFRINDKCSDKDARLKAILYRNFVLHSTDRNQSMESNTKLKYIYKYIYYVADYHVNGKDHKKHFSVNTYGSEDLTKDAAYKYLKRIKAK